MERLKTLWAKQWVKYVVVAIVAFGLGGALTSPTPEPTTRTVTKVETKTVEKEVTPVSCKSVINGDNQTFIVIGEGLQSMDFASITDHLNKVQDRRTAEITDCFSK